MATWNSLLEGFAIVSWLFNLEINDGKVVCCRDYLLVAINKFAVVEQSSSI